MILRARTILPLAGPPLDDGGLEIRDGVVQRVSRWSELGKPGPGNSEEVIDLGEALLMPGLVNAHCHLDYTSLAGKISRPRSFTEWIQSMIMLKASWSYSDFAASWIEGAKMLLRTGTTTVANVETAPEILGEVRPLTPLRVFSLVEIIQLKDEVKPGGRVSAAAKVARSLSEEGELAGLSPHAPYSTTRHVLKTCAEYCRAARWPLAVHVGESAEEFEMFMEGRGAMFRWLKGQREMSDCGRGSPVHALGEAGALGPNLLAIHVNYLAPGDAQLLRDHRVSVVHCPRSHDYFGHDPFPYAELRRRGVTVCLGTDSLATSRLDPAEPKPLNMFFEMQRFAATHPGLPPEEVLVLGTGAAARALFLEGQVGQLRSRARADLIVLPYVGPREQAAESALHYSGEVSASMIGGLWAIPPRGAGRTA